MSPFSVCTDFSNDQVERQCMTPRTQGSVQGIQASEADGVEMFLSRTFQKVNPPP